MGYRLGVDLGTTFTAAVVHRPGSEPTVVPLSQRAATMPSVIYLGPDGDVLIGDAAERRALTDPDRVVRLFKRRIGDETPLLAGAGRADSGCTAAAIAARMIALVADRVAEREGGPPDAIAVTVPATWGPHKKTLLTTALGREGLLDVTFVPEPIAVALAYARTGRLTTGGTVAVYDLGGGTFDAAVLRTEPAGGFRVLGRSGGVAELGGIDFDDAVLAHVLSAAAPTQTSVDADEPASVAAMARLRRECVEAKEALSADTVATIPVPLSTDVPSVRLTRGEFESLIVDALAGTLTALDEALDSADLGAADLDRVLLTGGSSRIPLVTQLLSARYPGIAIDRDIDPKLAVAIGGVLALDGPAPAAVPPPMAASLGERPERPPLEVTAFDREPAPAPAPALVPAPRRRRTPAAIAMAAVLVLGTGMGGAALWAPQSRGEDALPAAELTEETGPGQKKADGDRARTREQRADQGAAAEQSDSPATETPTTAAEPSAAQPQAPTGGESATESSTVDSSTAEGDTTDSSTAEGGTTDSNTDSNTADGESAESSVETPAVEKAAVETPAVNSEATESTAAAARDAVDSEQPASEEAGGRSGGGEETAQAPAASAAPVADAVPADAESAPASAEPAQDVEAGDTSVDSGSVEAFDDGSAAGGRAPRAGRGGADQP